MLDIARTVAAAGSLDWRLVESRTAPEHAENDAETPEPDRVGYSLANLAELLLACLDAAGARSVIEVGSDRGLLTAKLLEWAGPERKVVAIDPAPHRELEALERDHPELELIRETSHDVLREIELTDAIILDGDHNYFTLSGELELIGDRAPEVELPLLLFHDVCWPHARRDSYYVPERIPPEHRQPLARDAAIMPGDPGIVETGMRVECAAAHEGGERNGVLTAVEDFLADREDLKLATVPAFFGLGVIWHRSAPWAGQVQETIEAFDRNPLLARLEEHRVEHLIEHLRAFDHITHMNEELIRNAERLAQQSERIARQEQFLRMLLDSGSFALAEKLSNARNRGASPVTRAEIRRVLED